jgi:endonuclease-3 related protein
MPPLTELYTWYEVLRNHYATAERKNFTVETGSSFERALVVILGFGIARATLTKLRGSLPAGEALTPANLSELSEMALEEALRPAGLVRNKARKVRGLVKVWMEGVEAQKEVLSFDAAVFRQKLVSMRGIGQESADAVLLHALDVPVFAVNKQTYRLLKRHGFVGEDAEYTEMQELFYGALPEDAGVYKEYYRLIRKVAEDFCLAAKPLCEGCPLKGYMEYEPND